MFRNLHDTEELPIKQVLPYTHIPPPSSFALLFEITELVILAIV